MLALAISLLSAIGAEPRTAQGVLDAMTRAYARCVSYRDEGKVTVAFESDSGSIATTASFTTLFVRPDRFRFECAGTNVTRSPFRFILWREGAATRHWSSRLPGVKTDATFDAGVAAAAATAVSNRASAMVPSLLLPGSVASWGLSAMGAMTLGTEPVEGHDCFKIAGKFETNERTLWVDKKSLLLRRVEELMVTDDARTRRTVTYEPAFDEKIDDAQLAPAVPEGK